MRRRLNGWRLTECLLIENDRNVSWCIIWSMISVNVHNAHPASACAIRWMKWCVHNTYTHPHSFEIFVKTPERNFSTPNLPSPSCMDMYGQPDSLFFLSLEFFALLDWSTRTTRTVQSVDFVLRQAFYLKATSREYFSYVLIFGRSTISNMLFVLVWGFEFEGLLQLRMPQRDAEVMWNFSLSTSFNTVYELWTLPWKLMASSGFWRGSRRACFWEIELQPNQHC